MEEEEEEEVTLKVFRQRRTKKGQYSVQRERRADGVDKSSMMKKNVISTEDDQKECL